MILLAILATLLILACCRASGRCSEAEREREDELRYLERLWKSNEEPRV